MSLVKTGAVQVGQSGTASLNFHWRNLLDGLLRLTRGNAGAPIDDVMLVNADNSVEFPGNVASGVLGAGQTWQNVTASRVSATTYTNSTGKPIMVNVSCQSHSGATGYTVRWYINGVQMGLLHSAGAASIDILVPCVFVVPAGATYRVDGGAAIVQWSELR